MVISIAKCLQNSPLPRLEMRLLLRDVTGLSQSQLITQDDYVLSSDEADRLNDLVYRRQNGEPIAYLIGKKEFYGRAFQVSAAVLIPRPETEHLVELIIQKLPANGALWDVGTGSGIIAITSQLERPDSNVFASDISQEALNIAQQNASHLGAKVQFDLGEWLDVAPLPSVQKFDIIASNPPYIERHDPHLQQGDLRFEPQMALTDFHDGLNAFRVLANQSKKYLKNQGFLMFEHGYNQAVAVQDILLQNGFANIETVCDLAGNQRVTFGQMA